MTERFHSRKITDTDARGPVPRSQSRSDLLSPNDERRRWPRRLANLKVIHSHPKTQRAAVDFSRDVSRGGLFFWTKRQRAVGDRMAVEISATQAQTLQGVVRATCRVTRVTAEGVALTFETLEPKSEERLIAFLARLSS